MKIHNILISALVLIALSTQISHAEELDKEVRVTRAYTPSVAEATKLSLTPDTSNDTYIRPDIDYSITPISIGTSFESDLYQPTKLNFGEYNPQKRFYLKAGAGYPLNSVFDLYASSLNSNKGYVVGYANQEGRFADMVNDYNEKLNAVQNHIKAGVAGGLYLGNQTLEGALKYNNDRWSRYATDAQDDRKLLYQDIKFNARYGDNFLDLERLNFSIAANLDYFWSLSNYNSTKFGAKGNLGYNMLGGDVTFALGYNTISGNDDYLNNTFMLGLHYGYENDKLSLGIGLDFYNDIVENRMAILDYTSESNSDGGTYNIHNSDSNYVIPRFNVDYKLSSNRAIVYLNVDGDIKHNNFATLSKVNPYLTQGLSLPESSVVYDAMIGLKGRIANDKFGYNLHLGYNHIINNVYWLYSDYQVLVSEDNYYVNNGFGALISDQHNINVNLDLEYKPTSDLLLQLGISHRNFTNDENQLISDGEANTIVNFDGKYSVGKMRFGLNAEMLSNREVTQLNYNQANYYSNVVIPTTVNMGLSVDYRQNDNFTIFADVDNLLNDDIYNWLHYREYGINFAVGVKLQF